MKFRFATFLFIGTILTQVSCGHKDTRNFFNTIFDTDAYSSTYRSKTISERDTEELDSNILAEVTLWDRELREAYLKELTRVFRLSEEESKTIASQELAEDESYIVFIAAIETKVREWNRLDHSKGLWRLTLETPDGKLQRTPARIELVNERDDRAHYFYRSSSSFNRIYRVLFNREDFKDQSRLVFHITGPRGHLDFPFEILQ